MAANKSESIMLLVNLILLLAIQQTQCQNSTKSDNSTTVTSNSTSTKTTTTPSGVLLSGDEFVDFTETPTLLFDGVSNEINNRTLNSSKPNSSSAKPPQDIAVTVPTPNVLTVEDTSKSTLEAPSENATEPPEEEAEGDDAEAEVESDEANKESPNSQFKPPQNVSQYMDYIEHLFHDLRHQITDLFEPHIPQLIRTSQMVQLSGSCSYDMLRMALALRQFEPWALKMIDSSGKVPEGIFEGSFTALGSYDECLNTVFESSSSSSSSQSTGAPSPTTDAPNPSTENPAVAGHTSTSQAPDEYQQQAPATQGKYCLVNVSPFLPPKPPADRVERLFQEEANKRNYTKDDQFSRLSPMFYYMKFRIGVCIPSTCLDSDMDSISEALSSRLKLNITVPHCRVKQLAPLTTKQLVGGLTFGLVLALVVGATLVDCARRKWSQIERQELVMLNKSRQPQESITIPVVLRGCKGFSGSLYKHLAQHWSWMSFSVITNFKLYFELSSRSANDSNKREPPSTATSTMIKCLNGIRVLSLCWVIVANSYITLDPRATKRLSKTRDAPKDFLFQLVVQASLAIETFFFLSGILMSLSFANKLRPTAQQDETSSSYSAKQSKVEPAKRPSFVMRWIHFYIHRYIRMTPATMLVIAFSMFAYRYGDGPLWFEATHKAHESCGQNWWRHLLHVANFIDTRQMCFIHYWYIAADMQLFVFAPILMLLIYKRRRVGYSLAAFVGLLSMGWVFYTTYLRNLPPTLLFYNSDPESRREFGNTIMTKPLTHVLPYMVGMFVGKGLSASLAERSDEGNRMSPLHHKSFLRSMLGPTAAAVVLIEVFLPYKWNNSHLPSRLLASLYAALFRFGWSLALAYLVISCRHRRGYKCASDERLTEDSPCGRCPKSNRVFQQMSGNPFDNKESLDLDQRQRQIGFTNHHEERAHRWCLCGSGGNLVNRLLSLDIFTHLSKLSFVAYLIHLPLMSVFIGQTRGLFAFSHTLVIHLALSYLLMTFILSFVLVHIIELPFITFERYFFHRLLHGTNKDPVEESSAQDTSCKLASLDKGRSFQVEMRTSHPNGLYRGDRSVNRPRFPHDSDRNFDENFRYSERL